MLKQTEIDEKILNCKNNIKSLEELYVFFKGDVFALSFSIVKDFSLAEDCVQETFLRLRNASEKFTCSGYGKSFILKIAYNTALELNRKNRKVIICETEENQLIFKDSNVENNLFVMNVLNSLNDKLRRVFTLHVFNDLTFKEISKVINKPESTIKSQYQKAVSLLKAQFEEDKFEIN